MDRRYFLKQSALFSIGGLLLPSAIVGSCRKEILLEDINFDGKVIIIGAGAAGLYAAYLLKSKGIKFQLLEASANYGGRLGKLTGFANFPIDLGAQWMHGKNNIFSDFITKSDTKISLDDSDLKYWFNNQLVNKLPKNTDIFEGDDLPDISYEDYAVQKGFGNEYKYIIENIAGDQGADASQLSVYGNNKDEENWNSGDDDYKFQETYFDLIDKQIAAQVKDEIVLNSLFKISNELLSPLPLPAPIKSLIKEPFKLEFKMLLSLSLAVDVTLVEISSSVSESSEPTFMLLDTPVLFEMCR